jgi:hypothetical protein
MTAVVNEYSYELEDFLLDDDLMGFDFSSTSSEGVDTNSITSDSPFLEPGSEFDYCLFCFTYETLRVCSAQVLSRVTVT